MATAAPFAPAAMTCDGSGACLIDLSTVTIAFTPNNGYWAGYLAETYMNGSDGYAYAGWLPSDPSTIDAAGSAGFSWDPGLWANVGGSGINGYHEATTLFSINSVSFTAKAGYVIDRIDFRLAGNLYTVGNGQAYASPSVWGSGDFDVTYTYGSDTIDYYASVWVGANYQEGDDGTAADYGTASGFINVASLVAHVTAVPEPGSAALLGLGLLGLAALRRARPAS